ncbi:MAG: asparagine synthase (glutamine-hydrolyzing) [Thermodesulfobacteriota bacterium]
MCGIAGVLDPGAGLDETNLTAGAGRMAASLVHRGPDDGGLWVDAAAGLALAHRRLAIVDLSPEGRQPMISACGRFVVVYNGEIYNHRAIRQELEAAAVDRPWRGHSDTEVMLAAVAHWGVAGALARFTGMFAMALWDRQERALYLIRDRLGEKPLYLGWSGGVLLFGSELKALAAHPAWQGTINRQALALYLRLACLPGPWSIYDGIVKLPPGHFLRLAVATLTPGRLPEPEPYWRLAAVAEAGVRGPFAGDGDEAAAELERLLRQAVAGQMLADVPLGAFLSGGIDSSTVVALMQAQSSRPVRTFTIGFTEDAYNEAEHAKKVARYLGTDHTELCLSAAEAQAVIPELPAIYDEPFADSSQIPTLLVARMARRHVTVCLSGDGGDELFAGYNRHAWAPAIWSRVGWLPAAGRQLLAAGLGAVPPGAWDALFRLLAEVLPPRLRHQSAGDKLHKLAELLPAASQEDLYRRLVSLWKRPAALLAAGHEPAGAVPAGLPPGLTASDFVTRMLFWDTAGYLPDDILVKVDRASMAVSLEARVPLLDHHLVAFAWRLPLAMKIRNGRSKWLLRQVLHRYVPPELTERAKMGFGIPLDSWLRGPLRAWAEDLLDPARLRRQGYLRPEPIQRIWHQHLAGSHNWQHRLWVVLMFQAWLEQHHGG